ncbi:MAG: tRNA pseudouridine(38-40) synthase TruA [Halanaerobiaceae bacterium]
MANIKIVVEYDGTDYHGWQLQKNTSDTIQGKLETAVSRLNKSKVRVHGAGRTDAGVHARGQVANFQLEVPIPVEKIPLALNAELPPDIICKAAEKMPPSFHARYDTRGKKYCYRLSNNRFNSVFNRRFVYNIYQKLDITAMKEGLKQLEGCHDFSSFEASGSEIKKPVRTIKEINFFKKEIASCYAKSEYWLTVSGDGFLYNMVRIIAGTLIEVGLGKRKPEYKKIMKSCDRRQAGFTAPARGLTLVEVYY